MTQREEDFNFGPEPVEHFTFAPTAESNDRHAERKALRRSLRAPKILLAVLSFLALIVFSVMTVLPDAFAIPAWSVFIIAVVLGALCFSLEQFPIISAGSGIAVLLSVWVAEVILNPASITSAVLPKAAAIAVLVYAGYAGKRYRELSQSPTT
jgi:hypothetical protein